VYYVNFGRGAGCRAAPRADPLHPHHLDANAQNARCTSNSSRFKVKFLSNLSKFWAKYKGLTTKNLRLDNYLSLWDCLRRKG
jgi:hypothetical protein